MNRANERILKKNPAERLQILCVSKINIFNQASIKANGECLQNLTIQVLAAENAEAGAGAVVVAARSEEGEMPGMAVIDAQVEVFTVEEII